MLHITVWRLIYSVNHNTGFLFVCGVLFWFFADYGVDLSGRKYPPSPLSIPLEDISEIASAA